MKKPEILAPVGNIDMLYAGIAAGANSFYLALDDFGARAYAENFTLDNIKEVIDYCHLFDRKVFITMNTLIKDREMAKAISFFEKLYQYGVDGIIIQDLGFFSIIKDKAPGLDLHASTQMAVRDYHGAKFLKDLGFDRIVIARESPIEEIRKIASLDIETEVFVHGSLCVSFSGECLMSSYFGARSANRGRCAGPCRQKYDLIANGKVLGNDYYLNMKDLNTIDRLDELMDIGVDCLKIEGRMKTALYVYNTVSNYKNKIDSNFYDNNKLLDASNRSYTRGFIFGANKDYISLKDDQKHRSLGEVKKDGKDKYFIANSDICLGDNLEVTTEKGKKLPFTTTKAYKKNEKIRLDNYKDAKVNSSVQMLNSTEISSDLKNGLETYKNLPISIDFKAKINQYPTIKVYYKDKFAVYTHDAIVEKAQKIGISKEDIKENLSKFNDEVFTPRSINIDIDSNIFLRKKDINECRRQGISALKEEILRDYQRDEIKIDLGLSAKKKSFKAEKNIEILSNDIDPGLLKDFDNVYIRTFDPKFDGLSLYLILDSHENYKINDLVNYIKKNNIKGVILNNYRDLDYLNDFISNNIEIRIGRYLNVFNSYTFDFYNEFSQMICASVESDFETINHNSNFYPVEVLVYGRQELMNMRHCPFSLIKKCNLTGCKTCKFNSAMMKTADGDYLKVIRYGGYSKIYPKEITSANIEKLGYGVSKLYSVMTDEDILNIDKIKYQTSYEKGVI